MALGGKVTVAAAVVAVVVGLDLCQSVSGHSYEIGGCKVKPGAQNFQPDQLTGLWYVIKIFSTSSYCMTINFERTDDGFRGTEKRETFLGRKAGLDHILTNTGYFKIKDAANPTHMTVSWPSNFLGSADVTVMDIDSSSFAVLYECKSFYVIKRTSAVILSRQPTLDQAVVERIESDLAALDIDVSDFDVMNHAGCKEPGEADFNINVNEFIGNGFIGSRGEGEDAGVDPTGDPTFINFGAADADENEVFG